MNGIALDDRISNGVAFILKKSYTFLNVFPKKAWGTTGLGTL